MYKRIHSVIIKEYESNTEELIQMNRRFINEEVLLEKLRERLTINRSHSILEMHGNRTIFVILNPHGGNTRAQTVFVIILFIIRYGIKS